MAETADMVYGRLMESAHLSGYTFERVCSELEWLLDDDRWRQVGPGYDDINTFLGTVDLSPFHITADKRKTLVRKLDALQATQRATAKAIGVGVGTVNRDLSPVPSGTGARTDDHSDQQEVAPQVPDGTTGDNPPGSTTPGTDAPGRDAATTSDQEEPEPSGTDVPEGDDEGIEGGAERDEGTTDLDAPDPSPLADATEPVGDDDLAGEPPAPDPAAGPPAWFSRGPGDVARDAETGTRQTAARERRPSSVTDPIPPRDGRYRCIVIDPPWPMKKIERTERPNQGVTLDYPVLSLEQIADEQIVPVRTHAEDDCHMYLWVTHKYLPAGLELLAEWGFRYQCAMTWRKNVGITPFSWMYDTEHVLFGTRGNLPLERMGLRLSFEAPVVGHSVKPDVFYERVLTASPGPRIEMFARRERDGFTAWGNEVVADAAV